MRLMTAKTAGPIQAAETIIHGRRRGDRTLPQYPWTSAGRNTVHVNRHTARVFLLEAGHKKAHKAQKDLGGNQCSKLADFFFCAFCAFLWQKFLWLMMTVWLMRRVFGLILKVSFKRSSMAMRLRSSRRTRKIG